MPTCQQSEIRPRFEDLFASQRGRLLRALCALTHDPNEAEEIGQEAFVRVLERWDHVAAMADPIGYLYRVALNIFHSGCRRARLTASLTYPEIERDEMAEVENRDLATRMLGILQPQQRAALVLTAVYEYSSDEAGAILGVPGSSVRVLNTRARATVHRRGIGAA